MSSSRRCDVAIDLDSAHGLGGFFFVRRYDVDKDDAVTRGISRVPFNLRVRNGYVRSRRNDTFPVRDDGNVAAELVFGEDVGFDRVRLSTATSCRIVGLHQGLEPRLRFLVGGLPVPRHLDEFRGEGRPLLDGTRHLLSQADAVQEYRGDFPQNLVVPHVLHGLSSDKPAEDRVARALKRPVDSGHGVAVILHYRRDFVLRIAERALSSLRPCGPVKCPRE